MLSDPFYHEAKTVLHWSLPQQLRWPARTHRQPASGAGNAGLRYKANTAHTQAHPNQQADAFHFSSSVTAVGQSAHRATSTRSDASTLQHLMSPGLQP